MLEKPIYLDCVGSRQKAEAKRTVAHPEVGQYDALYIPNAPTVLSMGQFIKSGFSFKWDPTEYKSPKLIAPGGKQILLKLDNDCPTIAVARRRKENEQNGVSAAIMIDHAIFHFPMNPDCVICIAAKMKRRPARTVAPSSKHIAKLGNERVSVDLLESSYLDHSNNMYLHVMRDDASGYVFARPQRTKTPSACLNTLQEFIRYYGQPTTIRSDIGSEFEGEYEAFLRENGIAREFGVQYRSESDSRHERVHEEINRVVRVAMLQAGIPDRFWCDAALYGIFCINHYPDKNGITACERYAKFRKLKENRISYSAEASMNSHAYNSTCECVTKIIRRFSDFPIFGSLCFYYDDSAAKHESKARVGVILGGHRDGLALEILDVGNLIHADIITVRRSRDLSLFSRQFPLRKHNLRTSSDFELYEIIKEIDDARGVFCWRCKRSVMQGEVRCTRCKNPKAKVRHDNTKWCEHHKCKCSEPLLTAADKKKVMTRIEATENDDSDCESKLDLEEEPNERQGSSQTLYQKGPDDFMKSVRNSLKNILYKRLQRTAQDTDTTRNTSRPKEILSVPLEKSYAPRPAISPNSSSDDEKDSEDADNRNVSQEEDFEDLINSGGDFVQETERQPNLEINSQENPIKETREVRYPVRDNRGTAPKKYGFVIRPGRSGPRAFLTKQVEFHEAKVHPLAQAAIQDEVQKMLNSTVFSWKEVLPRHIAQRIENAQFVKAHFIMGIKNYELPNHEHRWKARLVAQGCILKNSKGKRVASSEFAFDAPASLQAIRFVLWNACQDGNDAVFADIEAAYLTAYLKGPPTFVTLPNEILPKACQEVNDPVFPLMKALYGLPRSGSDFTHYLRKQVLSLGWRQSQMDTNLYFKGSLAMALYVDDVAMSGRTDEVTKEFAALAKIFNMPKHERLSESSAEKPIHYIGTDVYLDATKRYFYIDALHYSRYIVNRYLEVCESLSLSVSSKKVNVPSCHLEQIEDDAKQGKLAGFAAEFNGMILWHLRTARPDLVHATSIISREVGRWTMFLDRILDHTVRYLYHNPKILRYQIRTVQQATHTPKCMGYADADYNGDRIKRKSTSGWVVYFIQGGIRHMVDWGSKQQGFTASSTADAELNAVHMSVKRSIFPLFAMLSEMRKDAQLEVRSDNEATIRAIKNGYSSALRMTCKINEIDLALMKQVLAPDIENPLITHTASRENVADISTKPLDIETFEKHCENMNLVIVVKE
mmetsp:Transcript_6096/g.10979  ORF Transcript_6096/g.10979 Transcript_6096/m.10979 type:complete len:1225 (+) Transcript_6096:2114-5788(+)